MPGVCIRWCGERIPYRGSSNKPVPGHSPPRAPGHQDVSGQKKKKKKKKAKRTSYFNIQFKCSVCGGVCVCSEGHRSDPPRILGVENVSH